MQKFSFLAKGSDKKKSKKRSFSANRTNRKVRFERRCGNTYQDIKCDVASSEGEVRRLRESISHAPMPLRHEERNGVVPRTITIELSAMRSKHEFSRKRHKP